MELEPSWYSELLASGEALACLSLCGNTAMQMRDDGAGGFSLTLPSFSGRLADGDRRSPLLRYPLTLGPARSVRLRPALRVSASPTTSAR